MISDLDCYPCLLRQALETARIVTTDTALQRKVMNAVMKLLPNLAPDNTPIRNAAHIHQLIRSILGVDDPYKTIKNRYNQLAADRLPQLKGILDRSADRLQTALRIAIAGNIIDFGALGDRFDFDATLEKTLTDPIGIDDTDHLWRQMSQAASVVYVGDNAGEIVFDRLFIEELLQRYNIDIRYIVRGAPVLNDVTVKDAEFCGLTDLVAVIEAGEAPGCEIDHAPAAVAKAFQQADLVLSKGQGNYEALSREPFPIYFLLKVKCPALARDINAPLGSSVVKRSSATMEKL